MASPDLSDMSVLLVDDESFSRTTVARFLDDMGSPTIYQAENGQEALDLLQGDASDIDFIVCDINMPVMHGLQLLRAVRLGEHHVNRALPFVMVTGHSDRHLVDMALALDVNAFLIKPVSKNAIGARISKMLEHTSSNRWLKPQEVYQVVFTERALDHLAKTTATHGPQSQQGIFTDRTNEPLFRPTRPHPLNHASTGKGGKAPVKLKEDITKREGSWRFEPPEGEEGARTGRWKFEPPEGSEREGRWKYEPPDSSSTADWPDEDDYAEDSGSGIELRPGLVLEGELCPLDELQEDAILARDVYTADGRLFMFAGTTLTPRIISILGDLNDLGHGESSIWIASYPIKQVTQAG